MKSGRTELVVLQPTSFCNLNCKYCYVPDRNIKARMNENILEESIKKLLSSDLLAKEVLFLWHAGEPLSVGIDFYEHVMTLIKRYNVHGKLVQNGIQTNATLINDKWCEFFKKHCFKIGVSLDGPKFLHDANRVGWNNKGSFDAVIKGIDFLRKHEIDLAAISVITKQSLDYPEELLQFFLNLGFTRLSLIAEAVIGENTNTSFNDAEERFIEFQDQYEKFIKLLFKAWSPIRNKIYIRELIEMSTNIKRAAANVDFFPTPQEVKELNILTIQNNGNISTYCPELAGGINENRNKFVIGNILQISKLEDILENENFIKIRASIQTGTENCKQKCEYFRLCGGRAPSHKIYETGSFEATETHYCRLQMQTLAKVLLEELKTPALLETVA